MKRTAVTLVYPYDVLGDKVGGVETFVRGFIAHAPPDFDISMIGVSTNPEERKVGVWNTLNLGRKVLRFFPVLYEADENVKSIVPLSLRFTFAIFKRKVDIPRSVLLFNRIEPAVMFSAPRHSMIGFIHNDIERQLSRDSEYFWRFAPAIYNWLEGTLFRRFKKVYSVNMNSLEVYSRKYPRLAGLFQFLPTWVDEEIFMPASDKDKQGVKEELACKYGIASTSKWLLFVGRLQKQKNPRLLAETFVELSKTRADSDLIVVGAGDSRHEVEKIVEAAAVRQRVHFIGSKPQLELAKFYRASDALVLTSAFEGMPRACVEALGCGLPVVTTDVGEVRRLIVEGRAGVVADRADAATIVDGILKVFEGGPNYGADVCVKAIEVFRPQSVLSTVYEECRRLQADS